MSYRIALAMVVLTGLARPAAAQQVLLHERTMTAFKLAYLLERPEVMRELGLERARAAYARIQALGAAERHIVELESKYQGAVAIQNNLPAIVQSIRAALARSLADNLTDRQLARLVQIERQSLGVEAFADPEVQAALGLSDEQKTQVRGLLENVARQDRELFAQLLLNGKRPSTRDILAGMSSLPQSATDQAVSLLTAQQQEKWRSLIGRRFFQDARGGY